MPCSFSETKCAIHICTSHLRTEEEEAQSLLDTLKMVEITWGRDHRSKEILFKRILDKKEQGDEEDS